jgi:uncharacterized membrane protein YfcA
VTIDPLIFAVMAGGAVAGSLGALLGLGGGVFLVPFLVLVLDFPTHVALGVSLTTVIATSSVVSAQASGQRLINLRLGLLLEVATAAGGLIGGLTAALLTARALERLFAAVTAAIAVVMLRVINRRNVIVDPAVDVGRLGGSYFEEESGGVVSYRVRRVPLALVVSFVAGNVSSLLGVGGGILKMPALNAWCGVPLRAAAATSAFMIGVTAAAGVPLYYARGEVIPQYGAAAVLGVMAGSRAGFWIGARVRARDLKLLMAAVLLTVSAFMLVRP